MSVEIECFAGRDREPIEMCDAQYKRARPIGQPTRSGTECGAGFEQPGIHLGRDRIMQHGSKGSPHHIRAFALREMQRIEGSEVESETVELEGGHGIGGAALSRRGGSPDRRCRPQAAAHRTRAASAWAECDPAPVV